MELHQSNLVLRVVPDVGGRLMSIQISGHEICFIHPELQGKVFDGSEAHWNALRSDGSFPLWGGGKTWVAPESAWPHGAPHRDLDSLPWTTEKTWIHASSMGVVVLSPVCRDSGLQIRRTITLPAGTTDWTVDHELVNRGDRSITCGVWDVLMLRRPAQVRLPSVTLHEVSALPNKPSVTHLAQQGILDSYESGVLLRCEAPLEFKCGFAGVGGRLDVSFDDIPVGYSRFSEQQPHAAYAHGHPLEVFNAPALAYFEVETHSPVQVLHPSECLRYSIHECVSLR